MRQSNLRSHLARAAMIACLPLGLAVLACASGDHSGLAAQHAGGTAVELLVRGGCATSQQLEPRLEAALAGRAEPGLVLRVVDQDALPTEDPRRGYATPTILVGGADLFGLPEPTPPFPEPS